MQRRTSFSLSHSPTSSKEKPVCLTWKVMMCLSQTVAVDHSGIRSQEEVWECHVLTVKVQITLLTD